jgi:predicted oxidoreductase
MGIDEIDLYQLHRPDPLTHPAETASALNEAVKLGHIKAVGVSNYYPEQVRALQKHLDVPIVSNQIELSLLRLAPFYEGWQFQPSAANGPTTTGDGNLEFCLAENIVPLAYSPLAKARLSKAECEDPIIQDTLDAIGALCEKYDASRTQIAIAWLRTHPSGIIPVVGSANPAHIFEAAQKADLTLEREDWYRLLSAAWGRRVP